MMFGALRIVVGSVVCLLVVLPLGVNATSSSSSSEPTLKVHYMTNGQCKTIYYPCNGQPNGCNPFCSKGIDKRKFICTCTSTGMTGHMEVDFLTHGVPTCYEQKLVANYDDNINKNLCGDDTVNIVTTGDRVLIRLKDYQNPSFFDETGECSCSDQCNCSYTACCVVD